MDFSGPFIKKEKEKQRQKTRKPMKIEKKQKKTEIKEKTQILDKAEEITPQKIVELEERMNEYIDTKFKEIKEDFIKNLRFKLEANDVFNDMVSFFCDEISSEINKKLKIKSKRVKTIKGFEEMMNNNALEFGKLFDLSRVYCMKNEVEDPRIIDSIKTIVSPYKESTKHIFTVSFFKEKGEEENKEENGDKLKKQLNNLRTKKYYLKLKLKWKQYEEKIIESRIKRIIKTQEAFKRKMNELDEINEIDLNQELNELLYYLNNSEVLKRPKTWTLDDTNKVTQLIDELNKTRSELFDHSLEPFNRDEKDLKSKITDTIKEKLELIEEERTQELGRINSMLDSIPVCV